MEVWKISKILVSIVVPAFNEENQIIPLIKSLLNQKFSHEYEIIIVDNQSTDNTVRKIKDFINSSTVKNLKIIHSIGKLGKVRNDGILNASGEWIAFIDADEVAAPNWLKDLLLKANEFNIVLGALHPINANLNFLTKFYHLSHLHRIDFLKKGKQLKTFGTGNLLVNYKIFEKGLLFDNNFPTAEDGDFSYRLFKNGYKFGYSEKAVIYQKIPENFQQLFHYQKKMIIGKLLMFNKYHDYYTFSKIFLSIFYFISPNFLRIFKKNEVISRIRFISLGLIFFFISIYVLINPFILLKIKKKISRPK